MLDTGTATVESELNTLDIDDTVLETKLRELETSASQVAATLAQSPLTTPKSTSQAAAGGTSAVILNIFTHQQASRSSFPTSASTVVAGNLWVGITLETKDIHPGTCDFVASLISKAAACNKLHLFTWTTALGHFISDGVARFDQFVFITSSYANVQPQHLESRLPDVSCERQFHRVDGTLTLFAPTAPDHAHQICDSFCAEMKPLRERPSPELLSLSEHSQKSWFES